MGIISDALSGRAVSYGSVSGSFAALKGAVTSRASSLATSSSSALVSRADSVADSAVSQAVSGLPSSVRGPASAAISGAVSGGIAGTVSGGLSGGLSGAVSGALSSLTSLLGGSSSSSGVEDWNALRQLAHTLVHKDFVKSYQFRLDVTGQPAELDLYAKDISYGCFDVQTDEVQAGGIVYAYPTCDGTHRISMTLRDTQDQRVWTWLRDWMRLVVHADGTVGIPSEYVRTATLYNLADDGTETVWKAFELYPTQCGDVSRSREQGEFMDLPVVFTTFHSSETAVSLVSAVGAAGTLVGRAGDAVASMASGRSSGNEADDDGSAT